MTKILLREPYLSRYQRWQDKRIEQMGFVNNLLIGLASVLLFWLCEGVLEGKMSLEPYVFWGTFLAGICLFASLAVGLWLATNWLEDFRKTADLIRNENEKAFYVSKNDDRYFEEIKKVTSEIESMKKGVTAIGLRSWRFLKIQAITFAGGLFFLGISVILKVFG